MLAKKSPLKVITLKDKQFFDSQLYELDSAKFHPSVAYPALRISAGFIEVE